MSLPSVAEPTDLMKPEQLAAEWQVSPKTLANLRSRREGPPYVRVLGVIRYSRRAVNEWLAAQQAIGAGGSVA
jgi:Helix-turn-helix domain